MPMEPSPSSAQRSSEKGWFARIPAAQLSDEVLARARGDVPGTSGTDGALLQQQESGARAKAASRLRGATTRRDEVDPRAAVLLGAVSLLQKASSGLEKRAQSDAASLSSWMQSRKQAAGQGSSSSASPWGATASGATKAESPPQSPPLSLRARKGAVSLAAAMVRDAASKAATASGIGVTPFEVIARLARETRRNRQASHARFNADLAEHARVEAVQDQTFGRAKEELAGRAWIEGQPKLSNAESLGQQQQQQPLGGHPVKPLWVSLEASAPGLQEEVWAELLEAEPSLDEPALPFAPALEERDGKGRELLCASARRLASRASPQGFNEHGAIASLLCSRNGNGSAGADLALLRSWSAGSASKWAADLANDSELLDHMRRGTDRRSSWQPDDAVLLQAATSVAGPDTHAGASLELHDKAYVDRNKKPANAGQSKNKGGEAPGGAGAKMTQDVTALLRDNLAVAAIRYLPAQLVTTGSAAVTESTINVLTRWLKPRLHAKIHKGVAAKLRLRLSKSLSRAVTARVVRDTHAALERDLSQGLARMLPLILAPATADLTNYRPEKDWYCAICKATKGKGDLYCQYCKNPDTGMWNVQVVQAQYYAGFYGAHAAALHPAKIIPASQVEK